MTRLTALAAVTVTAAIAGGCGTRPAGTAEPAAQRPAPPANVRPLGFTPSPSPTVTSTTLPLPAAPWAPPPAAIEVARRYVIASLTFTPGETPRAWGQAVAPWCTPAWAAELADSAGCDNAIGDGANSVTILAVYPSAGPGPGGRLEVTAQVTSRDTAGGTRSLAAAVDVLRQSDGAWLVGWSG
jgi:hypothetical protein